MAEAAVNGTSLYYETVGHGRPCLVLHGGLGLDHSYLRGLDALGRRLGLVYYDHRCHGRSGRPPVETLSVQQLADDADALAAHLGDDPVLVLGHAQGGFVAQELALRHPERVAGLVLVGTSPGELGRDESLADDPVPPVPVEVEVLQRVPPATDEEWAATMAVLAPFWFRHPERFEPASLFAGTIFNAQAVAHSMWALASWSGVDRLGGVAAPALVLVGRHDVFYPPAQVDRITRRAPAATAVVFDESGHVPWLEEPDAFQAAVEHWLDATGLA